MKTAKLIGYHFTGASLRDGSKIPRRRVWLKHSGTLEMCSAGLHGSLHPFDALQYAPGERLHLCEFAGEVIHQSDKRLCRRVAMLPVSTEAP